MDSIRAIFVRVKRILRGYFAQIKQRVHLYSNSYRACVAKSFPNDRSMKPRARIPRHRETSFADNGEQRSRTNWDFAEPLTKGRICQGVVDGGSVSGERGDEDAMKRQCEDYRLVASRPIIWWFSSRRVLPGAPCSVLSRATAHKRVLFHTEMPARHSGGRINRAERAQ